MAVVRDPRPAVLRVQVIGDVHVSHDLDPGDDAVVDHLRQVRPGVQHAVDPEAHRGVVAFGFDVDVARPIDDRRLQHEVGERDDRRRLDLEERVDRLPSLRQRPGLGIEVLLPGLAQAVDHLVRDLVGRPRRVDHLPDGARRRDLEPGRPPGRERDRLLGFQVGRIPGRDDDVVVPLVADRENAVPANEVLGQETREREVGRREVGDVQSEVAGDSPHEDLLAEPARGLDRRPHDVDRSLRADPERLRSAEPVPPDELDQPVVRGSVRHG